jgi:hypothetical protein
LAYTDERIHGFDKRETGHLCQMYSRVLNEDGSEKIGDKKIGRK